MKNLKKIVTVVGNRPQFIKMAPVSRAIQGAGYQEIVIHTGQHYDPLLSDIFFRELGLAEPDYRLMVQERSHGKMTAELLHQLEDLFLQLRPQSILVYGDTNSTLAAALAAVKMGIPIAHVEAGPRLYNKQNPEEMNRVMTDHISTLLFCPDHTSVQNLAKENITQDVYEVGDVMFDLFLETQKQVMSLRAFSEKFRLSDRFVLMTLHRAENVDHPASLQQLLKMVQTTEETVLFPLHLRTKAKIKAHGLWETFQSQPNLRLIDPLGYHDMVAALTYCTLVITDSGGLQKEAFFASKPCFVCFDETPWPELLTSGWLVLLGHLEKIDLPSLKQKMSNCHLPQSHPPFFGDGTAAQKIVSLLAQHHFFYSDS